MFQSRLEAIAIIKPKVRPNITVCRAIVIIGFTVLWHSENRMLSNFAVILAVGLYYSSLICFCFCQPARNRVDKLEVGSTT
jgi:predicted RND superfamily exporter protein